VEFQPAGGRQGAARRRLDGELSVGRGERVPRVLVSPAARVFIDPQPAGIVRQRLVLPPVGVVHPAGGQGSAVMEHALRRDGRAPAEPRPQQRIPQRGPPMEGRGSAQQTDGFERRGLAVSIQQGQNRGRGLAEPADAGVRVAERPAAGCPVPRYSQQLPALGAGGALWGEQTPEQLQARRPAAPFCLCAGRHHRANERVGSAGGRNREISLSSPDRRAGQGRDRQYGGSPAGRGVQDRVR